MSQGAGTGESRGATSRRQPRARRAAGAGGAHRMSSRARTHAVVVPSPAASLVRPATSLMSCAPAFSAGSGSTIARAIVTPSLITWGTPNFSSSTTLRPASSAARRGERRAPRESLRRVPAAAAGLRTARAQCDAHRVCQLLNSALDRAPALVAVDDVLRLRPSAHRAPGRVAAASACRASLDGSR